MFYYSVLIFTAGLLLLGSAGGADIAGENDASKKMTQTQSVTQPGQPTDDTQKQYIDKLVRINTELRKQHAAFARNYNITRSYYEKMNSDLQWGYAEIPAYMLKNMQDLADEKSRIEGKVTELEKEKEEMKSDALSHYNGRMPDWLSQKWAEEEKNYLDYVYETYLQLQWSLQKSRTPAEEKKHLDFIWEHYKQRQIEMEKTNHQ